LINYNNVYKVLISIFKMLRWLLGRRSKGREETQEPKEGQLSAAYVRGFPVMRCTQREYDEIPRAEDLDKGYLQICPLGTRFRFKDSGDTPETTVIGEVVDVKDLLSSQAGGCAQGLHEREANNRYRPVIKS